MKTYKWNTDKDMVLKRERGKGFHEVLYFIENHLVDIVEHPNKARYPEQKIYVIDVSRYIWLVPFIESETEIFLKTIIPSRKATKKYLKGV